MGMTILDVQAKTISEEISNIKEFLAAGRAKDYVEYRELCGLLRGLGHALEENQRLSREMQEADYD
jgi:hypothetical protein